MPNYIDANSVKINTSMFKNNQAIISIDCNNVSWNNYNMYNSFYNCRNLVTVTNINDATNNLFQTFCHCISLTGENLVIPSAATNMEATFWNCSKLINAPTIPNSVTSIIECFGCCGNLVNAPDVIPNNITNLAGTFYNCYNLTKAPTAISSIATDINAMFSDCHKVTSVPNIPNSVVDMSYAFCTCNKLVTAPAISTSAKYLVGTFLNCYTLTDAPEIPNSVTNFAAAFKWCNNLVNATSISSNVIDMAESYDGCIKLVNIPRNIPNSAVDLFACFRNCFKVTGDIYIHSENVINALGYFADTSETKNVYIPFTYNNGQYTKTYNSFINAGYTQVGTLDGVYLKDLNAILTPESN